MKPLCPYCKAPLSGAAALPHMRPRKMRIYKAVAEAGSAGIKPEDLMVRMYDENQWPTPGGPQVLRVMICEINKIIGQEPWRQRIAAHFGNEYLSRYKLFDLNQGAKYEKEQKKAQPDANH